MVPEGDVRDVPRVEVGAFLLSLGIVLALLLALGHVFLTFFGGVPAVGVVCGPDRLDADGTYRLHSGDDVDRYERSAVVVAVTNDHVGRPPSCTDASLRTGDRTTVHGVPITAENGSATVDGEALAAGESYRTTTTDFGPNPWVIRRRSIAIENRGRIRAVGTGDGTRSVSNPPAYLDGTSSVELLPNPAAGIAFVLGLAGTVGIPLRRAVRWARRRRE